MLAVNDIMSYHTTKVPTSHVLRHLQVAEARERRRLQQEHEDRENALLRHELAEEQRREQAQKVNSHEIVGSHFACMRLLQRKGPLGSTSMYQAVPQHSEGCLWLWHKGIVLRAGTDSHGCGSCYTCVGCPGCVRRFSSRSGQGTPGPLRKRPCTWASGQAILLMYG